MEGEGRVSIGKEKRRGFLKSDFQSIGAFKRATLDKIK